MIPYASRTGTRRNLSALKAKGWRLMVSARGVLRTEGFRYALDNGAWTASEEYRKGLRSSPAPDLAAFARAVDKLGSGADFIVVPDIVMGGARSLALSRAWLRRLRRRADLRGVTLLIAVQNGFMPWDVAKFLGRGVGIFVGGDTDWKLATMEAWARLAHSRGAICHVGRVNSARRATLCDKAGVDSFDGSGPSRFEKCLNQVDAAFDQPDLIGWGERASREPAPPHVNPPRRRASLASGHGPRRSALARPRALP